MRMPLSGLRVLRYLEEPYTAVNLASKKTTPPQVDKALIKPPELHTERIIRVLQSQRDKFRIAAKIEPV